MSVVLVMHADNDGVHSIAMLCYQCTRAHDSQEDVNVKETRVEAKPVRSTLILKLPPTRTAMRGNLLTVQPVSLCSSSLMPLYKYTSDVNSQYL